MKAAFDWIDQRTGLKHLVNEALFENVPGGARCARLVTTRRADALPEDAVKIPVNQMQTAEVRTLIGAGFYRPSALFR